MNNQLQALSDYTFISKYAKYLPDKKRRENWQESIDRSFDMHRKKYSNVLSSIEPYLEEAKKTYLEKRAIGSLRNLQFAGGAVFKHNARSYNCSGSYCDRMRFFQEAMYLLLCGTGVGFSVQKHHINKLPDLITRQKTHIKHYVIEDSIEGWSNSIGVLISSYMKNSAFPEYEGYEVKFDYSQIRPAGSSFSHGIGQAPGPDPLEKTHEKIRELLNTIIENGQTRLRPIDAYDIVMHTSDAVLSGGIRRSATICLFSPDDEEMLNAKTGSWFITNPQRGRSNNSVVLLRDKITKEQFDKIIKSTKDFGEPGFIWVDDLEYLTNPCSEIGFYCYDEFGNSGWQFCNLSTINGSLINDKKDFLMAARSACILGTCQAGYTDFPYLGEVTERISRRESLLGVSITGIMENLEILGDAKIQSEVASSLKDINKELAFLLGINPAARITTIKPEGSASCLLGTSSGIHPHHSRRFIRRVQANKLESPVNFFKKINPRSIEESTWSNNKSDYCIAFSCEVSSDCVVKKDLSALQFLQIVKDTQLNWVTSGKNLELCSKPFLNHNVSNTCIVKPDEWNDVGDFIYNNRNCFTGVSLISNSGDKDYNQAPFTEVLTPEEIVEVYGNASLFASGLIDDALSLFDGNLWSACDCALGIGEDLTKKRTLEYEELIRLNKEMWVSRLNKFSKKYYKNNLKLVTYLLKDVYNWKLWMDVKKDFKRVDYTDLIETMNQTKGTQEITCGGGACEIT